MAKTKVPKRVGGVKIPKKVRKQAKQALAFVDTPAVRDLAIAGLTMAAEKLVQRRGNGASRSADLDDLKLGDMLRQSAIEGARRFLAGFEEGRSTSQEESPAQKPARPRKPNAAAARRPAAPAARG